jgi:integrase
MGRFRVSESHVLPLEDHGVIWHRNHRINARYRGLDTFTPAEPDALVFTSPEGKPLRHSNFRRRVWLPALTATGLDIHLHDLRHTGNNLIAQAGVNLRELMERMGHSSSRAALIYLHSTSDRQHRLADAVAVRVQSELGKIPEDA